MAAKCKICKKSVYPMDPQINLDGSIFHKPCAKCQDCNCQITISNFCKNESADQTILLCKTHYFKRFHEGGSYLGGEKFSKTATRDANKPDASVVEGAVKATVTPVPSATSSEEPVRHVFKKLAVKEESAPTPAAAPAPAPVAAPAPAPAPEPVKEEPTPVVEEPTPVVEEPTPEPVTEPETVSTNDEPAVEETVVEESGSSEPAAEGADEY